jgi:hypothetical protein
MFFCDPFGHTRPENLFNHGSDLVWETDYIFFHDQEPVQLTAHQSLFREVLDRNEDIIANDNGRVVTSERGEMVDKLCDIYGWKSSYYFFHGWACLDWYRGYHRTFLFPRPGQRSMPSKTFMSPNRIIGGERDHRSLFVYHCIKNKLVHNHISSPKICPVEHVDISSIGEKYQTHYPDIKTALSDSGLPWLFRGEETQQMTSCWLGNFAEAMDSMIYVPTETVYFGQRLHITEKTFKAIAMGMPFVLVAPAGSLGYLKEYGFQTFDDIWDESYDQETDDLKRLEKVVELLKKVDQASSAEKQQIWQRASEVAAYNWNHFYHGGFEKILWQELVSMLNEF